ncbi:MAG: DsbE family thiol:disulfide interchange protein [Candidatus Endonucleobacter bathymodioli]|uniref:DsbE family thiol:disulfide interchange protein n=1 Tax=Candidatus Endonucleibacter bathymodioli TaxID=539814 RepID=A0AA90SMB6_9GAMM|nr:DsbE family thiol:disulfide interchange protein [Candidatus Endonucleobacter bathymodioli]
MKQWQLFLPLSLFLALCVLLYAGLFRGKTDILPSPLLNQPLPEFHLATVLNKEKLVTSQDMIGEVALLNVWATWCFACKIEHPYLLELAKQGVPIYGVNYNDDLVEASSWLTQLDNPYRFSANDYQGSLSIDLGVYGPPETYLIDHEGVIRYKHTGIIDEKIWNTILNPRYKTLLKASTGNK